MIFRAVAFGNEHTGTHGDALEEAHHHVDQACRGADRRQGGIAQVTAHHPGVEGVVKLLEEVAQENGEGKEQNFGPDGTLCQVLAGGMGFVVVIMKPVAAEGHNASHPSK